MSLLTVKGLDISFSPTSNPVKVVSHLNFEINEAEVFGLVGESGCGKSTVARVVLRLLDPQEGSIRFRGQEISRLSEKELKPLRRQMQIVFQDPYSSLNPRMPVIDLVGEPMKVNGLARGQELEDRVADLLRRVGLRPEYMKRYPHAFSGGERQRIGIARALSLNPRLVLCDEAVSALDVSVRAQILNLLEDLQQDFDLTYLFIAHDLSVVEHISGRVAVMYVGLVVETARQEMLYSQPQHPYTEALLSAVPQPVPNLEGVFGQQVSRCLPPGIQNSQPDFGVLRLDVAACNLNGGDVAVVAVDDEHLLDSPVDQGLKHIFEYADECVV